MVVLVCVGPGPEGEKRWERMRCDYLSEGIRGCRFYGASD